MSFGVLRLWFFRKQIIEVTRNVLRTPKDIYEIELVRNINQPAVDLLPEYMSYLGVINRHRNDLESCSFEIAWDVKGGLARLRFSLYAEHRDPLDRGK